MKAAGLFFLPTSFCKQTWVFLAEHVLCLCSDKFHRIMPMCNFVCICVYALINDGYSTASITGEQTMLDALDISSPLIRNALLDTTHVVDSLLVAEQTEAFAFLHDGHHKKELQNVYCCYTKDASQLFPGATRR